MIIPSKVLAAATHKIKTPAKTRNTGGTAADSEITKEGQLDLFQARVKISEGQHSFMTWW